MILKAMQKVGNEGVTTVEENKGIETELDVEQSNDRGHLYHIDSDNDYRA